MMMTTRWRVEEGDLIASINDEPMASPDASLEVYSRLRVTDALFVRIHRRGEDRLHVYRIVG